MVRCLLLLIFWKVWVRVGWLWVLLNFGFIELLSIVVD